ncbi:MAG: hypothetical protein AAFU85_13310 [Planctomycetota bacterium]
MELYKTAIEARNFEITWFWQRSNYFLVLNTAIAVGFFSLNDAKFQVLLSFTGVSVALLWLGVNLGSKFWQSRWEYRVHKTETELGSKIGLFSADWQTVQQDVVASFGFRKHGWLHRQYQKAIMTKPSVTLMMTLLSVLFIFFWITSAIISVAS